MIKKLLALIASERVKHTFTFTCPQNETQVTGQVQSLIFVHMSVAIVTYKHIATSGKIMLSYDRQVGPICSNLDLNVLKVRA